MNKAIYYSAKKINNKILKIEVEKSENIRTSKKDKIHDTVIRRVLMHKREAVILINNTYGYKLKEKDIELYNNRYVTKYLMNRETDVIYKMKNKDIFFLLEHQSKVDYNMPTRVMEYQAEIIRQAIQNTDGKKKEVPLVKAIVVYTGKEKWNVAQTIEEMQVKLDENEEDKIGSYKLIEINNLTEDEKLNNK